MVKRVVLIGNGYFGSLYRERLKNHKKLELVAVVDADYKRLVTLEGMTIASSYNSILSSGVDHEGVIICTPPDTHADLAIMAMRKEKHVLCMKPGALSRTEAARVSMAQAGMGGTFNVDYTQLYSPEYDYAKNTAYDHGPVTSMNFQRNVPHGPKSEGVIMDLFPHDVAMLVESKLVNLENISVRCVSDAVSATAEIRVLNPDVPHHLQQQVRIAGGYNAVFPTKRMSLIVKPDAYITNPRIEFVWDQISKSVTTRTQGRDITLYFKHDPDNITRSLNDWLWRMTYDLNGMPRFNTVMRILHAMQQSADNGGIIIEVTE